MENNVVTYEKVRWRYHGLKRNNNNFRCVLAGKMGPFEDGSFGQKSFRKKGMKSDGAMIKKMMT